jgi:hypothetical protein
MEQQTGECSQCKFQSGESVGMAAWKPGIITRLQEPDGRESEHPDPESRQKFL